MTTAILRLYRWARRESTAFPWDFRVTLSSLSLPGGPAAAPAVTVRNGWDLGGDTPRCDCEQIPPAADLVDGSSGRYSEGRGPSPVVGAGRCKTRVSRADARPLARISTWRI